jgi:hypothetical protein
VALGWDQNPPMGHVAFCKKLRLEGLQIFVLLVGYCMKDNEEEHFEVVHHKWSLNHMNEC